MDVSVRSVAALLNLWKPIGFNGDTWGSPVESANRMGGRLWLTRIASDPVVLSLHREMSAL